MPPCCEVSLIKDMFQNNLILLILKYSMFVSSSFLKRGFYLNTSYTLKYQIAYFEMSVEGLGFQAPRWLISSIVVE
jgi:hypothetical protein